MESSAWVREAAGRMPGQHLTFQPTQPRVIKGAGEGDRAALALLCQWYWYPIYSFLRHLGTGPLDARDVTQGFFARMLEPKGLRDIAQMDLQRSRFRCWLSACAKHHLLRELDRARARKRGGGTVTVSVDAGVAESRFQLERREVQGADAQPSVAGIIDRETALMVVERALARLRETCRGPEMTIHFEDLQRGVRRVAAPSDDGDEELAARLGTKANNLRKNRSQVRKRFRELVRDEVGAMVADPASIQDELRRLRDAL